MLTVMELYARHGLTLKAHANGAKGRELQGPCPKCGGKDRFIVYADQDNGAGTYFCRQCGMAGDVLQWLRDVEGMSWKEACKETGRRLEAHEAHSRPVEPRRPEPESRGHIVSAEVKAPLCDGAQWRKAAESFVQKSHDRLLEHPAALAYLAKRGLPLSAVKAYRLGWCPADEGKNGIMRPRSHWGLPLAQPSHEGGKVRRAVWLPRGIVIPAFDAEGVCRVRIRRTRADRKKSLPDLKYYVVPGSVMSPMYLPVEEPLLPAVSVAMVVEAELDAMAVHHACSGMVSVLGAMTACISSLPPDIFAAMRHTACLLISTDVGDASAAGAEGWKRWERSFAQAQRWPCDGAKDPGEMVEKGASLRDWLLAGLPSVYADVLEKAALQRDASLSGETEEAGQCTPQPPVVSCPAERAEEAVPVQPEPRQRTVRSAAEGGEEVRQEQEMRKIWSLDTSYGSIPMLMKCLKVHGLRFIIGPRGRMQLSGQSRLSDRDSHKLLDFLHRHSWLLDILEEQMTGKSIKELGDESGTGVSAHGTAL